MVIQRGARYRRVVTALAVASLVLAGCARDTTTGTAQAGAEASPTSGHVHPVAPEPTFPIRPGE
jgi:predicted small secreted protein